MGTIDLDAFRTRSRAVDLSGIDFAAVPDVPLSPEALRTIRYMQDIETHTIIYVRTLLHTRAIDDPEVAHFLSCWFFEEMAHGRALARFLEAAGVAVPHRPRSRVPLLERLEQMVITGVARAWPDFLAVHMTWGAINEITALQGYKRLAAVANHPVLSELLARLARDESRHFDFYFHQADRHLRRPGAARVTRFLVDRFWGPVGTGVQSDGEVRFLAEYLLSGPEGAATVRRIDSTLRRLPGLGDVDLIGRWLERAGLSTPAPAGTLPAAAPAVPIDAVHPAGVAR